MAAEEAERLGHKHVGTEHLLLGILREEKCFGAEILMERGLRLSTLREELARTSGEKRRRPAQGNFSARGIQPPISRKRLRKVPSIHSWPRRRS